jgi:hypothetical protein
MMKVWHIGFVADGVRSSTIVAITAIVVIAATTTNYHLEF